MFLTVLPLLIAADFPAPAQLPPRAELPDPLVTFSGQKITSKDEWFAQRRPELKALFQHYMYGVLPPAPAKVTGEVLHTDPNALGGKATLREIALTMLPGDAPKPRLLLVVPNDRKGPVPTFVGLSFCGNHAIVDDPKVQLPTGWIYPNQPGVVNHRATDAGRGKQAGVWNLDLAIARGYAVATMYNGDIDPDEKDHRGGLRPWLTPPTEQRSPSEAGTIACWAWGLMRAADYLATVPEVDAKRLAVVGHSRLGKTALLAAAFDDRFALAIPHQAGCGGTAPSRTDDPKAESVARITTVFPHWFCPAFARFGDDPKRLPFDQNCLAALVAPRPVLFSNAADDLWANPSGQFQVLKAADPVYRLLGVSGLETEQMPELGKLSAGRLGYFIRAGKHSMNREDWGVFLDFADRQLK